MIELFTDGEIITYKGVILKKSVADLPPELSDLLKAEPVIRKRYNAMSQFLDAGLSYNSLTYVMAQGLRSNLYRELYNTVKGTFRLSGVDPLTQDNFFRLSGQTGYNTNPFDQLVRKGFEEENIPLTVAPSTIIYATLHDIAVTWGQGVQNNRPRR